MCARLSQQSAGAWTLSEFKAACSGACLRELLLISPQQRFTSASDTACATPVAPRRRAGL
jgi:hypothetical protein